MAKKPTFNDILRAAINDVVDHGFDKAERMEKWLEKLRLAAMESLPSESQMEQWLRDGLVSRYKKLVDGGEIARINPGVSTFTLRNLAPKMHDELTKRIMASAQLIKLNRKKSIDATLQRFAGWMSSVPAGGTEQTKKRETKAEVGKALSSLPYEERRVLIDQSHKLVGSINEVVAESGGAIAGTWHSLWRMSGYNYREDHKERDEQVFLIRDSWAHKAGLVKPGKMGFYGDTEKVAELPFCSCYMGWIFALRSLPPEMLTAKGKAALADARAKLAS
jgi:hypothetical protein